MQPSHVGREVSTISTKHQQTYQQPPTTHIFSTPLPFPKEKLQYTYYNKMFDLKNLTHDSWQSLNLP